MAPLSVLPGRIRLEGMELVGKVGACRYLERKTKSLEGVVDVHVNHRTGRVLVKFDENFTDYSKLAKELRKIIDETSKQNFKMSFPYIESKSIKNSTKPLLVNLIVQAILPKPLDTIVSWAVSNGKL